MAKSFKSVIESVLEEISLCGDRGASPTEVLEFIDDIYSLPDGYDRNATRAPIVDHQLKCRLWTWLTHHPEVSVGKNREGNGLSLDQALPNILPSSAVLTEIDPSIVEEQKPTLDQHGQGAGFNVFVSEKRTWNAITGHDPDASRVFPLEFALLSIIASRKSKGIIQGELVRLSGQDKRSVPKRTDQLQKKGYIEKKAVQYKGARTSLCILKKYDKSMPSEIFQPVLPESERVGKPFEDDMIDFTVLLDKLFECLKKQNVIERNDLKRKLGMTHSWRSRILQRAVRKLEAIGCVRRVRAVSQYSHVMNSLHHCVMLVREPTAQDIQLFHDDASAVIASFRHEDHEDLDEAETQDTQLANESIVSEFQPLDVSGNSTIQDAGRIIPRWQPDYNLPNFIFNIIDEAGTTGINNIEIASRAMGSFFKRPIEGLLTRLVESPQRSQPQNLRHLNIIRDLGFRGTIYYYVHYSLLNFEKLVAGGQASWEAVKPSTGKGSVRSSSANEDIEVDKFGFVIGSQPSNLLRKGNATLRECLEIAKPENYKVTKKDPRVAALKGGAFGIDFGGQIKAQSGTRQKPDDLISEVSEVDAHEGVKRTAAEAGFSPGEDGSEILVSKKQKKNDPFEGMTELERLRAQGYDEGWTVYEALTLERQNHGLYLTNIGKRRADGNGRGRPRKSQIAIFKLPRLKELDWFTVVEAHAELPTETHPDEGNAASRSLPLKPATPIETTGDSLSVLAPNLRSKPVRKRKISENEGDEAISRRSGKRRRGRHHKRKLAARNALTETLSDPMANHQVPDGPVSDNLQDIHNEPQNEYSGSEHAPSHSLEQDHMLEETEPANTTGITVSEPGPGLTIEVTEVDSGSGALPLTQGAMQVEGESSPTCLEAAEPGETKSVSPKSPRTESKTKIASSKQVSRGGSIAFQRRQIVMDIVEQCGGMHPAGAELWYSFSTIWFKKRTERPDMRTIRNTIGSLIESGKLRQHTFSGRNSRGLMVTKSIIALPEIDASDPTLRDLQNAVLKADPQLYIHPKATIDPNLRKTHRGLTGHEIKLPALEEEIRVTLNYVPAKARPRISNPSRIFRFIRDNRMDDPRRDFKRVHRLKSLHRPSSSPFLDSLSFPAPPPLRSPQGLLVEEEPNLLWDEVWRPSVLSMLMYPTQTYNEATGTFGTAVSYIEARKRKRRTLLPKVVPLPNNLDEILSSSKKPVGELMRIYDRATAEFHGEIDAVRDWETRNTTIPRDGELRFIDHRIQEPFESAPLEGPVLFEPPPRRPKLVEPRLTRQRARLGGLHFSKSRQHANAFLSTQGKGPRRLAQLEESTKVLQTSIKPVDRIWKRLRHSTIPQEVAQKLMVAIVVVRTLAGAWEGRLVDWPLVASVFPEYDCQFIQGRGKNLINRHRLQLAKMQRDFQQRYIEAYENGTVPSIDYNDLESYDWNFVVEWADQQLEKPTFRKVPSLPATHEQFKSVFGIRKESSLTIDDLYSNNVQCSIPRKRMLCASLPLANSVNEPRLQTVMDLPGSNRAEAARRLEIAKTWVRSNVITAAETYQPAKARGLLERFGEELIADAIRSLITDRVISMGNRGKVSPGRNYDVTEYFLNAFGRKRLIEATQLRRALYFKTNVLDSAIREEGKYRLPYEAEDGDIMVLINMISDGSLELLPVNPPRNKYGLTDFGYLTRMIDKSKLRFDIEVRSVPGRYTYGNPLEEKIKDTPVPEIELSTMAFETLPILPKLPLWIDVHGQFVKLLWELAVASVLGLVAVRPGATTGVISRVLQPYIQNWEADLILQWLDAVGAVESVNGDENGTGTKNWTVKKWWYLTICS